LFGSLPLLFLCTSFFFRKVAISRLLNDASLPLNFKFMRVFDLYNHFMLYEMLYYEFVSWILIKSVHFLFHILIVSNYHLVRNEVVMVQHILFHKPNKKNDAWKEDRPPYSSKPNTTLTYVRAFQIKTFISSDPYKAFPTFNLRAQLLLRVRRP
jgi:hypothetical protein